MLFAQTASRNVPDVSTVAGLTTSIVAAVAVVAVLALRRATLVDETVAGIGAESAGALASALSRAEAMTDDQGRSLLDQPDDDDVTMRQRLEQSQGQFDQPDDDDVTMRQRLEQSQGQLDQLRNDPRLAASPFGKLLDWFLGDDVDAETEESVA